MIASERLETAVRQGHRPLVAALAPLELRAAPHVSHCKNALYAAPQADRYLVPLLCYALVHPPVLCLLLQLGADPNLPDSFGHSPLTWAVCGGHLESVLLLLAYGARVSPRDPADARYFGHLEILRLLAS